MRLLPRPSVSMLAVVAALAGGSLRAQCELQPNAFGVPGVAGPVEAALRWDPDGSGPLPAQLVLAGRFVAAGATTVSNVAAFDPATGAWSSLGGGVSDKALALAQRTNGELIVGGDFQFAGGAPAGRVARYDGQSWASMGAANGEVLSLLALPNGDVIAGGAFTSIAGVAANRIARWNGSSWSPLGIGMLWPGNSPRVLALAAMPNGDVIAGGWFTSAGGVAAIGIARWNGVTWSDVGGGLNSAAVALEVQANGDLVVAGEFGTAGGVSARGIARWDGAAWSGFGSGLDDVGVPGKGFALATMPNGDLVVTGRFTTAGGTPASHIARWDGATWQALGAGLDVDGHAVVAWPGGEIFVGGLHGRAGGVAALAIARWTAGSWSALHGGIDGPVTSMIELPNGDLVIGGEFSSVDGVAARNIARFDGVAWQAMGAGLPGDVTAMTLLPNGDLAATGGIHVIQGFLLSTADLWDGSQWSPMGTNYSTTMLALATLSDGTVVSGGFPVWGLRAWNGATWSTWPGVGTNWSIRAIVPLPNGAFVAGGQGPIGGSGSPSVGLWDGAAWQPLGAGLPGTVFDLAIAPDGSIYAAGILGSANGVAFGGAARWDGTAWQPLGGGLGPHAAPVVREVEVLPNGHVLFAGNFTTAGGLPVDGLARWDGSAWHAEAGASGLESTLFVGRDGLPRIGGSFVTVGATGAPFFATFESTCPASVVDLGGGCAGAGGANLLAAEGLPWLGSTLRARGTGLAPTSLASVVYGASQASTPLSALLPQGVVGCDLLVTPDVLQLAVPTNGAFATSIALPSTVSLVGVDLYQQFIEIHIGASASLVALTSSNALHWTLGSL